MIPIIEAEYRKFSSRFFSGLEILVICIAWLTGRWWYFEGFLAGRMHEEELLPWSLFAKLLPGYTIILFLACVVCATKASKGAYPILSSGIACTVAATGFCLHVFFVVYACVPEGACFLIEQGFPPLPLIFGTLILSLGLALSQIVIPVHHVLLSVFQIITFQVKVFPLVTKSEMRSTVFLFYLTLLSVPRVSILTEERKRRRFMAERRTRTEAVRWVQFLDGANTRLRSQKQDLHKLVDSYREQLAAQNAAPTSSRTPAQLQVAPPSPKLPLPEASSSRGARQPPQRSGLGLQGVQIPAEGQPQSRQPPVDVSASDLESATPSAIPEAEDRVATSSQPGTGSAEATSVKEAAALEAIVTDPPLAPSEASSAPQGDDRVYRSQDKWSSMGLGALVQREFARLRGDYRNVQADTGGEAESTSPQEVGVEQVELQDVHLTSGPDESGEGSGDEQEDPGMNLGEGLRGSETGDGGPRSSLEGDEMSEFVLRSGGGSGEDRSGEAGDQPSKSPEGSGEGRGEGEEQEQVRVEPEGPESREGANEVRKDGRLTFGHIRESLQLEPAELEQVAQICKNMMYDSVITIPICTWRQLPSSLTLGENRLDRRPRLRIHRPPAPEAEPGPSSPRNDVTLALPVELGSGMGREGEGPEAGREEPPAASELPQLPPVPTILAQDDGPPLSQAGQVLQAFSLVFIVALLSLSCLSNLERELNRTILILHLCTMYNVFLLLDLSPSMTFMHHLALVGVEALVCELLLVPAMPDKPGVFPIYLALLFCGLTLHATGCRIRMCSQWTATDTKVKKQLEELVERSKRALKRLKKINVRVARVRRRLALQEAVTRWQATNYHHARHR